MYLAALVSLCLMAGPDAPLHESELIFPPEPFHNHSSSIVETPGGDLITCWFHGVGERKDDTLVISGSRKKAGQNKWTAPFLMADNKNLPDQNCTLFIDPENRLWMFWISSIDNLVRSYFPMYRTSVDYEGEGAPVWNWQAPLFCFPKDAEEVFTQNMERRLKFINSTDTMTAKEKKAALEHVNERRGEIKDKLFQRIGWMPRQPPIMLTNKRMMLGLYSDVFDVSMFAFTEDAGQTWEFSKPLSQEGIQPALVRKRNGNIVAFMRDSPVVRRAESKDGGMNWTDDPIDIANSGSSVAAIRLKSGNWLLFVNDLKNGRHVLTAFLSDDEGKSWKWKRPMEKMEPGKGGAHYPTIIEAKDGSIHSTYTFEDKQNFEGKTIKHVRFNEAWIKDGSK